MRYLGDLWQTIAVKVTGGSPGSGKVLTSDADGDATWQDPAIPAARTLTAGAGLSGGGDLSADRTFAVNVDDTGIEINSDTLRLKDGGVTSAKIADGTIVNADINASAAIALSKLATDPLARANHTGTQSADTITDGTTNKAFTAAEKTKLAAISGTNTGDQTITLTGDVTGSGTGSFATAIAAGAIVNADINASAAIALSKLATDPLARANHTGSQLAATISDFDTAVLNAVAPDTLVTDTYSRSVSNGWGTADTGQSWSLSFGSASNFAVGSGVGTQDATGAGDQQREQVLNVGSPSQDITVDMTWGSTVTGGDVVLVLAGRVTDSSNRYDVTLWIDTSGTWNASLRKQAGGVTTLAANFASGSFTAGASVRIRLQLLGSAIKAKAWAASGSEPSTWGASVTDSTLTSGSSIALQTYRFGANTSTTKVASFDNLQVNAVEGAWTSFTPTLVQSGAVTKTVTYARYMRTGNLVVAQVQLAATGAGTASNQVRIGLPIAAATTGLDVGTGRITDTSATTTYQGFAILDNANYVTLANASGQRLGSSTFTAALASGDTITYSVMYEAA